MSWEGDPHFLGAFKATLPGHYRYNRRMFTHFVQDGFPAEQRGLFLAGDDVSFTAGFAEGAVRRRSTRSGAWCATWAAPVDPANPGPGDIFEDIAPILLPEE